MVFVVQDGSPDKQFDWEVDGDEILYMDFNLKKEVGRIPEFQHFTMQGGEETISGHVAILKQSLNILGNLSHWSPGPRVAPQIAMYPEDSVEWGQSNTLICLADGFYPPRIIMKWKKNNEDLTDGVNITEYYTKLDYSYQRFTYLKFTPSPGDMYSCHVEHEGLEEPTTVFWEAEVPEEKSGPGTVICALGVTLGIISAVVGIILLIKERQRLQAQQHGI
ncbi:H-2 class II histocompatibility antigen, A-B alpha chain-like [Scyliorhinus canicula]|uniref:H-2 class II histocompatibility antigen, A-B alpha chain-like n=1 Tax=Scyliorhinus canicula TaxID=7830 RepID=UPI0018F7CDEE|nr:H-2 class II histocompatibility antigen, A-B alpha chain-like [Scyliorhinus canicula]